MIKSTDSLKRRFRQAASADSAFSISLEHKFDTYIDLDDEYQKDSAANLVNDAVVTNPDAPQIGCARKFDATGRAGIGGEGMNSRDDANGKLGVGLFLYPSEGIAADFDERVLTLGRVCV